MTSTAVKVRWDRIQNASLFIAVVLTVALVLWHGGAHVCSTAHRPVGLTLAQWRQALVAICGGGR